MDGLSCSRAAPRFWGSWRRCVLPPRSIRSTANWACLLLLVVSIILGRRLALPDPARPPRAFGHQGAQAAPFGQIPAIPGQRARLSVGRGRWARGLCPCGVWPRPLQRRVVLQQLRGDHQRPGVRRMAAQEAPGPSECQGLCPRGLRASCLSRGLPALVLSTTTVKLLRWGWPPFLLP